MSAGSLLRRLPTRGSSVSRPGTLQHSRKLHAAVRGLSTLSDNQPPKPSSLGTLIPAVAGGVFVAGAIFYYINQENPSTKTVHEAPTSTNSNKAMNLAPLKNNPSVVFVLGGPGAGKGTQCTNLVKNYGFVHLSAGDLLRAEQNTPGSPYGQLIKDYIKEGNIVPFHITIALLHKAMCESGDENRFLIDGFPRAMDQAEKFEKEVCKCKFVLYYECPEEEMLKRLLKRSETSGRIDDNIESIRKRFRVFADTSYPVIEYFKAQNKVESVSCNNPVDVVFGETRAIFDKVFK